MDELERTEIANRDHRAKTFRTQPVDVEAAPVTSEQLDAMITKVTHLDSTHDMWTDFTRLAAED